MTQNKSGTLSCQAAKCLDAFVIIGSINLTNNVIEIFFYAVILWIFT